MILLSACESVSGGGSVRESEKERGIQTTRKKWYIFASNEMPSEGGAVMHAGYGYSLPLSVNAYAQVIVCCLEILSLDSVSNAFVDLIILCML